MEDGRARESGGTWHATLRMHCWKGSSRRVTVLGIMESHFTLILGGKDWQLFSTLA